MSQMAVLLLGSNLGDREKNLKNARELLSARSGRIEICSSVYISSPWGNTNQDYFLNQVISISTQLNPIELLENTLQAETEMGRIRTDKWGPRIIDIDILYYNDDILNTPELRIPHPGISMRRFTLIPLIEILPDFIHPELGITHIQMLTQCRDTGTVSPYEPHDQ